MPELKLTTIRLDRLVPDPANPRTHDERNLTAIAASLREHGQVEPLLVQQSTMIVVGGNGRAEAMRRLGWATARVALLDLDDVAARRLSIALNRTGELAGWDEGVLAGHLAALRNLDVAAFDVEGLGFGVDDVDALIAAYVVEPKAPKADDEKDAIQPKSAPGTAAAPMPASGVHGVSLTFDDAAIEPFQLAIRKLAVHYGTDNVTDTVNRAVLAGAAAIK